MQNVHLYSPWVVRHTCGFAEWSQVLSVSRHQNSHNKLLLNSQKSPDTHTLVKTAAKSITPTLFSLQSMSSQGWDLGNTHNLQPGPQFFNELLHLAPSTALPRGPTSYLARRILFSPFDLQVNRDTTTQRPHSQKMTEVGFFSGDENCGLSFNCPYAFPATLTLVSESSSLLYRQEDWGSVVLSRCMPRVTLRKMKELRSDLISSTNIRHASTTR